MPLRILTPEYYSTGISGLMLLCASSSALASYTKLRLPRLFLDYDATYTFTLVIVVLYGFLIGAPILTFDIEGGLLWQLTWLAGGTMAGLLAFYADRRIVAFIRPYLTSNLVIAVPTKTSAGAKNVTSRHSGRPAPTRLLLLLASAGLEELAFRGFMLQFFLFVRPLVAQTALVGALVPIFALTHLWFGWTQVVAKLPLGTLTLGVALCSGSLTPAILTHLTFNLLIWRRERIAW
jgi:hypothetical protein